MACNYPITILRKGRHELVPCGKCINCIQRKRSDWSFRLLQEQKISVLSTFLTLTYNEKYVKPLSRNELQRYFKRIRVSQKDLKYYAVAEYGTMGLRPHYHAIVFNCNNDILVKQWNNVENHEPLGFVTTDQVTEASIHYVTGYVTAKYGKMDEKTGKMIDTWDNKDLRPFALMSKGLGKIYLKHGKKFHKDNFTTTTIKEGGQKQLLPRYYRDKIFTDEEKELLNEKLQKEMSKIQLTPTEEFKKREYKKQVIKTQIKRKTL
ncbi:MAG: replication initiator protein [Microvirus sp.]|nr:MAG: replication initiator protein [Microvirus sp.]